jgi:hypothetical protein
VVGKDYLNGFLDCFTAASTIKGMVFAGPSLPAPDEATAKFTPWPVLGSLALLQQELESLALSALTQNDVRISAPSYPQIVRVGERAGAAERTGDCSHA